MPQPITVTAKKEFQASAALLLHHCIVGNNPLEYLKMVGYRSRIKQQQQQHQQQSCPVFAQIDAMAMGSPANLAGLEEEDLNLEFGPLNPGNHFHLKVIANLVPQMADKNKWILSSQREGTTGGGAALFQQTIICIVKE